MDDLAAFLNARLDEDEAAAKAAASVAGPDWHYALVWPEGVPASVMLLSKGGSPLADMLHRDDEEMAPFVARFDPARVLREVEVGRRILRRHRQCGTGIGYCDDGGHGVEGDDLTLRGCGDLYDLAAIWSDHPDYPKP